MYVPSGHRLVLLSVGCIKDEICMILPFLSFPLY